MFWRNVLALKSVEERRTVRDSQGKEETSITVSGGPGRVAFPDYQTGPVKPGQRPNQK